MYSVGFIGLAADVDLKRGLGGEGRSRREHQTGGD
jgi:hypothetical protein